MCPTDRPEEDSIVWSEMQSERGHPVARLNLVAVAQSGFWSRHLWVSLATCPRTLPSAAGGDLAPRSVAARCRATAKITRICRSTYTNFQSRHTHSVRLDR